MRVYHMSQTLKPGDTMRPDHRHCTDLATPFVQALSRSKNCFYAMVYQGQYLCSVFDHSSLTREWVDYAKWATEGAFEFVRQNHYPHRVSRLKCNYFFGDLETLKVLFRYDWGGDPEEAALVRIYAMELREEQPQRFDMRIFDEAYEAMEKRQDLDTVLECAMRYFAGERSDQPVMEILSGETAEITDELAWLHRELMDELPKENGAAGG